MDRKEYTGRITTLKVEFQKRVEQIYCSSEGYFHKMVLLVEIDEGQSSLGFYLGEDGAQLLLQCNNHGDENDVVRIDISSIELVRSIRLDELVFSVNASRWKMERRMDQIERELEDLREACNAVP